MGIELMWLLFEMTVLVEGFFLFLWRRRRWEKLFLGFIFNVLVGRDGGLREKENF